MCKTSCFLTLYFVCCILFAGCGTANKVNEPQASSESKSVVNSSMDDESAITESEAYQENTNENPTTPYEEGEEKPASEEVNEDDYSIKLAKATALEEYLLANLSPKDYGGIVVLPQEKVTIDIWAVNEDAVNAILQQYKGPPFDEINLKKARCSMESMYSFVDVLKGIRVADEEFVIAYISEYNNSIAVNIPKAAEERLRREVEALMQAHHIPTDWVAITVIDPNVENPVT